MEIKKFKQFENIEDNKLYDYILFLPSGEILNINDNQISKSLLEIKLIYFVDKFSGHNLDCYCAQDKNLNKIKKFIKENDPNYIEENECINICREFRDRFFELIYNRYDIAYYMYDNAYRYHAIIPNLNSHSIYKKFIDRFISITKIMKDNYPDSYFYISEKMDKKGVKYFRTIN